MKYKPVTREQAIARLRQALDQPDTLSHEQAQAQIADLVEAEQRGEDVDSQPQFAALLRHLATCDACLEIYLGVSQDMARLSGEADLPPMGEYAPGFFTPRTAQRAAPRPATPTLETISRYFLTAPAREANRTAARTLSRQVLRTIDAQHPMVPTFVLDTLLDRAAQGQIMVPGTRAAFGFGDFEMLIQVIAPLAVQLIARALWERSVESVAELAGQSQTPLPQATEQEVGNLLQKAGMKASPQQIATLTATLNRTLAEVLLSKQQGAAGGS